MSNLVKRILSALVLAPVVIGCLWGGGYWFLALMTLTTVLLLLEWRALVGAEKAEAAFLVVPGVLALALTAVDQLVLGVLAVVIAVAVRLVSYTLSRKAEVLWSAVGLAYIMLAIFSLIILRGQMAGQQLVLWLFVVIWATDIGGYVVGKLCKGPKLAPSISPGKTWSGLAGCVIFAGIASGVCAAVWHLRLDPMIVMGALVALVAQAGDLLESKIKRLFGKKDSGALIPGHGGLLDRVDGLLAAAPVLVVLLVLARAVGWGGAL